MTMKWSFVAISCIAFAAANVISVDSLTKDNTESLVPRPSSFESRSLDLSSTANVDINDSVDVKNVSTPLKLTLKPVKKAVKKFMFWKIVWKIIKYVLGAIIFCVLAYYLGFCCLGFCGMIGAFLKR